MTMSERDDQNTPAAEAVRELLAMVGKGRWEEWERGEKGVSEIWAVLVFDYGKADKSVIKYTQET